MAKCTDCIHRFVCETLKGRIENTWAETCVAYRNKKNCVEVVRCKDCIYYIETVGKDSGKPCGYGSCGCTCQIITGIIYDEDFCSYGERKDNENKKD